MSKLSWKTLDRADSADDIASMLIAAGVKGKRGSPGECPLARATGWLVSPTHRFHRRAWPHLLGRRLTGPQATFVRMNDRGDYPDLIDDDYPELPDAGNLPVCTIEAPF